MHVLKLIIAATNISCARKHFEGGGHVNAAGGRSDENIETTLHTFKEVLKDYYNQLQ